MKIICRQRYPTDEQNIVLGYDKGCTVGYELTVNQQYTVLGINFQNTTLNRGVIFLLRDDFGRCAFVPICLLDVASPALSKLWIARKFNESDLCLWPEEFFSEYFHDDLTDGVPAAVAIFERVCQALVEEDESR